MWYFNKKGYISMTMKDPLLILAEQPITSLKGVGGKSAEKLARLGLNSLRDLILHLPTRYEDRTRIYDIASAPFGQKLSIEVTVTDANVKYGRTKILILKGQDRTGFVSIPVFQYGQYQLQSWKKGAVLRCFGELKSTPYGVEMGHPDIRVIDHTLKAPVEHFTPLYRLTEGLGQVAIRKYVNLTLQTYGALLKKVKDHQVLIPGHSDVKLADALFHIHFPPTDSGLEMWNDGKHPMQLRLIKEELLAYQVSICKLKHHQSTQISPAFERGDELIKTFLGTLPYNPTGAQERVGKEIAVDLKKNSPMMRLVQGDVGSGKTLVAAMAALRAVTSGYQVALMAPTDILAEQHAIGFSEWFEAMGVRIGWLSGKLGKKAKDSIYTALKNHKIDILIGTHAVFQDAVVYSKLGLVIIDEQHRFGVHQRLALKEKGGACGVPHQLVMTATPIPRTLAMVSHADLNTSIIDELPPGRTPVKTVAISDLRRDDIIKRIRQVCKKEKKQVYWVCTLIDESEAMDCQTVEDTSKMLAEHLPDLRVDIVHGRLKADYKRAVMNNFKAGDIDLLVATTVIEVGVNVPNASLMVIENPERLGLAQLHQLRGRVGRGAVDSHCILLFRSPISAISQKRLSVLRDSNDGFVVAQKDLEIRGPGDLLGPKQTGSVEFRIADIMRDEVYIPLLQDSAQALWEGDRPTADYLIQRWGFDIDTYSGV
jgi:ATP-dependent DNA helicase RecG